MQASDLELTEDNGWMLTGLSTGSMRKSATNMKVDKDGKKVWWKHYGNHPGGKYQFTGLGVGDDALIIDECWGIMSTRDSTGKINGHAISCGTGIENCGEDVPSDKMAKCLADPRKAWRSLVLATDMDGERVWSRMDNLPPGDPNDPVATSAAEYIFPMSNGSIGVITDEAWGMGFLELAPPNGKQCPSG